jgi:hypothetical protein
VVFIILAERLEIEQRLLELRGALHVAHEHGDVVNAFRS